MATIAVSNLFMTSLVYDESKSLILDRSQMLLVRQIQEVTAAKATTSAAIEQTVYN